MKTFVSSPPAHPETNVFRVARCFALFFISILFTACGSSRKSTEIKVDSLTEEHEERLSMGQAFFALFDSLTATHTFSADSLELDVFDAGISGIKIDSLAATRPPQSQAPGRLAARLKVKGIRSNTQLTHTQTSNTEKLSVDTASLHRVDHEQSTEQNSVEKELKPPNTFCHMALFLLALALLIVVGLYTYRNMKR